MTNTPTKPIRTATHLKIPTFSLNKKIDNTVINNGPHMIS